MDDITIMDVVAMNAYFLNDISMMDVVAVNAHFLDDNWSLFNVMVHFELNVMNYFFFFFFIINVMVHFD